MDTGGWRAVGLAEGRIDTDAFVRVAFSRGGAWQVATVAPIDPGRENVVPVSPPSLAVDRAGTLAVTVFRRRAVSAAVRPARVQGRGTPGRGG